MTTRHRHAFPFGATLLSEKRTRFRFWAPDLDQAEVIIEGSEAIAMARSPDGWFEVEADCGAGARYCYRIGADQTVPDPASRAQQSDVHGPSLVIDPDHYVWQHPNWRGRPWQETILYEVHPGSAGGFAGLAARLPELAALGITAIELMPIADFPGRRNWGYDGVLPFAPDTAYGTPEELKSLIDRAHELDLMIFLDVVYNHFGPDGNYLPSYASHFFRQDLKTPWGPAIDFRRPEVRNFFIQNALYWLLEYRFDGLRLDAVHAIADPDWLRELAAEVHAKIEPGRHVHLVLENDDNTASLLQSDYDAQWNDDIHHVFHVLLTGETEGYYGDYHQSPIQMLARCLVEGFAYQGDPSPHRNGQKRGEPSADLPPTAFVSFLQNHDQIGNRAFGERLTQISSEQLLRAAVTLLLLSPQIPLIFMGEEWGCRTPFLYFTDHNAELAAAVRDGRRQEFRDFAAFAAAEERLRIPDPNDEHTFRTSIPTRTGSAEEQRWDALYRNLLAVRRREIVSRIKGARALGAAVIGPAAITADWVLGDRAILSLICNLGSQETPCPIPAGAGFAESRLGIIDAIRQGILPAQTTGAFLQRPSA